jgi:hypothetical protein
MPRGLHLCRIGIDNNRLWSCFGRRPIQFIAGLHGRAVVPASVAAHVTFEARYFGSVVPIFAEPFGKALHAFASRCAGHAQRGHRHERDGAGQQDFEQEPPRQRRPVSIAIQQPFSPKSIPNLSSNVLRFFASSRSGLNRSHVEFEAVPNLHPPICNGLGITFLDQIQERIFTHTEVGRSARGPQTSRRIGERILYLHRLFSGGR